MSHRWRRSHRLFWHAEIYMSHRNSQKSQKFSLRFLSAARAEGTFRDFRDFCVTKNKVNDKKLELTTRILD